jgi:DNA-binding transcriptional MocR family regulator
MILSVKAKKHGSILALDGIHLNRSGDEPLYVQVAAAIRGRIQSGAMPGGSKLPATRDLALALTINRTTAVEAYRLLREDGWVRSGVGSGTFVVSRESEEEAPVTSRSGFWSSRMEDLPRPEHGRAQPVADAATIRLTSPTADPAAFPLQEFREVLDEIFRREGAGCLDYGPPDGYAPLREVLAERLARQGVQVDPPRILLTNGSQQGLELIFRLLVPQGRTLLIEEPTYQLALRTARALRLNVRAVGLDDEGLRLDALSRSLDETRAGMLYTMPVFQNPTGLTLSPERRTRLLALASERGLPIVEDHFDAELDYRGDAPPPLLAEGSPQNVVLLGTFSKILFPGLRVGWIVVPEPLIGPLSEMKVCADLSGGLLTQMALYEFCRRGLLDTHLSRIRERNAARLAAMLGALEAHMPSGVRWTRPTGGMCLWLHLPKGLDADELAGEALRRGVAVSAGTAFHTNGGGWDGLRLCFIREDEERIRAGIRQLALTIEDGIVRGHSRESEGAAAPIL